MKALIVPVNGPVTEADLDGLEALQAAVGGSIESVPIPDFVKDSGIASAYINEEGKIHGLEVNMRATDFFVPGIGIFYGDYIAGPLVLIGFDPATGEDRDIPDGVVRRIRLIEREAGG